MRRSGGAEGDVRRSRGEGRIFRPTYRDKGTRELRRCITWAIRWTDAEGKEHTEHTGKRNRKAAVDLLNERLHALRVGEPTGPYVERTTFEDLAAMIEADYRANGRRSTARMLDSLTHLRESFAGWRVVRIAEDAVTAYAARRLADTAKPATINRELSCLKRMLRLGARARKVGRVPHVAMLEERNRRRGFFEPAQFRAVRDKLPADLKALSTVAYITGWRIASELAPLTWAGVDFVNGLVRIEDSKNGEAREFYFTPDLRETLEAQRHRTDALQDSEGRIIPWVFWRVKGPGVSENGAPLGSFRKAWQAACVAAGLGTEERDSQGRLIRRTAARIPHDFRRTAVRNLELAGVPRSAAMAMVGHRTESVYRRYAIVDAEALRLGAERLAKLHEAQSEARSNVSAFPSKESRRRVGGGKRL